MLHLENDCDSKQFKDFYHYELTKYDETPFHNAILLKLAKKTSISHFARLIWLMRHMVQIYYWLRSSLKRKFWIHSITSKKYQRYFDYRWLFWIFCLYCPFLSSVYKFWCIKKHHLYYLYYILYTLSFRYLYIVSEIYIGKGFLKDGYYSQQIISAVAKESLIRHNLTQRATEIQNL